jgi:hypothetical protein
MTSDFKLCAKTRRVLAAMPIAKTLVIVVRRVSSRENCEFNDMADHLAIETAAEKPQYIHPARFVLTISAGSGTVHARRSYVHSGGGLSPTFPQPGSRPAIHGCPRERKERLSDAKCNFQCSGNLPK